MTTAQPTLMATPPTVLATPVLNAVHAGAVEPLATVEELLISIYGNMRKRALQDAILNELVERNNARIAAGKPPIGQIGATPRPPLPYLANAMKNARAHDKRVWEMRQSAEQPAKDKSQ